MPRVVVAGGGYAGVRVVRRLDALLPRGFDILLIEPNDCHQLTTRLPEIVAGRISAQKSCIPYPRLVPGRVRWLRATVDSVDPAHLALATTEGQVESDWLVLAMGTTPDRDQVAGASDHALPLKSISDAQKLKVALEEASLRGRYRVGVIGAGYTSCELVGELSDPRATSSWGHPGVTVVASDPGLLPEGNPRLAGIAQRVLSRRGVELRLGEPIEIVERDHITLRSGESIACEVVIWAAQTRVPPALADPSWVRGIRGRLRVDPYLRALPFERVFVAGDDSLAIDLETGRYTAATAQVALAQADVVARNIARRVRNQPLIEFRSHPLGEALSLGSADGAAEVGGIVITGSQALTAKQAALARYLWTLGGFRLVRDFV